jgi:hypothetical protein
MNKFIITAFVTLMLSVGFGATAEAQVHVKVKPNRPANVTKKPTKQKNGFVWVAGHWMWNKQSKRYVWVKAHHMKRKAGHNWTAGRWVNNPGKGHKWVPGHWKRH